MASIKGDKKLRVLLRRAPDEFTKDIRKSFDQGSRILARQMRSNVRSRTGNLRSKITHKVSRDGLGAKVGLRGKRANKKAFYGKILESDKFRNGRFKFMEPAFKKHSGKISKVLNKAIDKTLKRLVG